MRKVTPAAMVLGLVLGLATAPALPADDPDQGTADRPTAGTSGPSVRDVDPDRFGRLPDAAYGAFQRGLYITALNLATPRAENGDPAAQTLVAEIYARGLGVRRDEKKAAEWYAKAAEQGVPEAQFQFALMLIDGRFVEKDTERAFHLMQTAADNGKKLAQFNLGQMLMDRATTIADRAKAVDYYERAARAGLADAQYAMAQIDANGVGGRPVDEAAARRWLVRAARQNFDTAQLDLGTWLIDGRGGEIDEESGFAWMQRAAQGGNVAAQNRLAKLYRAGIGNDGDPIMAAAWYVLARRAGLKDPVMEDFLNGLTEEQTKRAIEQANRLR